MSLYFPFFSALLYCASTRFRLGEPKAGGEVIKVRAFDKNLLVMTDDIQAGWVPVVTEDSTRLRSELSELQERTALAWARYNSLASQVADTRAKLATAVAAEQSELAALAAENDTAMATNTAQQQQIEFLKYELTKYKVELAFIKGPGYRLDD